MKTKFLIFLIGVLLILAGCHREQTNTMLQQKEISLNSVLQLLQQIDSYETNRDFNGVIAKEYIDKAVAFASAYPEDPMSAELLYKAGLIAMAVAKIAENEEETELYSQKALTIFDDVLKIYPEFSETLNCILNKGVIYDELLHDFSNAELYYREFIAKSPSDSIAINIESCLQYLGNTPEEIISQK
jgi:tetratricopeptide (TPR) repeat protein